MSKLTIGECALCGRRKRLDFHHLIARTLHSNKWFKKNYTVEQMRRGIDICRDCHSAIHKFIDQKEMGRAYNTREKLLAHPEVARFVVAAGAAATVPQESKEVDRRWASLRAEGRQTEAAAAVLETAQNSAAHA